MDSNKENRDEVKKESFFQRRGSSRGFNIFKLNSFSEKNRPRLSHQFNSLQNADVIYDLMKTYLNYDEEAFMSSIVNHMEFTLARTRFSINHEVAYKATALSLRDRLIEVWNDTQIEFHQKNPKRAYYFSIEYLQGRALQNALLNMEIQGVVKNALMKLGMNLESIQESESDPGLGNGGLGRLASCFLDSMATLNLPVWGYGLRYTFGIFNQTIINGEQYEVPDYWLQSGNPWEIQRDDISYIVQFYGNVKKVIENGKQKTIWEKGQKIKALAFDNPIPGYDTFNTINLRLWKSVPCAEINFEKFQFGDYYGSVKDKLDSEIITSVLYPNDNTIEGRMLRLKQQYFFVSASIQDIIRRFKSDNKDFQNFPQKVAIQLNDTHPSLAVVELLRYLIDIEDFPLVLAWKLVSETFSYTNHTVLPEALEKWPVEMLDRLLPRHLELIFLINHFWIEKLKTFYPDNPEKLSVMSLIEESPVKSVRMANLSIISSHKVNGVAFLHTEILKQNIFRDFYNHDPDKFINITNGVTPRRWVNQANPELSKLYTEVLGDSEWIIDYGILEELQEKEDNKSFQNKWIKIKNKNKLQIVQWVKDNLQLNINPNALFDVMVKRIHEYKRQLLYLLYILYRYQQIRKTPKNQRSQIQARVFFLGGKAAPGYHIAKRIIKFAHCIADQVNNDLETKDLLSFVFLPNYRVSLAEKIIPAADLSEHISTAGTEASGTSNMKFQMNGCLIIGTLDGANIEIGQEIGFENMFVFGLKTDQIEEARQRMRSISYDDYFCQELRELLQDIRGGLIGDPNQFQDLLNSFTNHNDYYLIGTDFLDYKNQQEKVDEIYRNKNQWAKKSIHGAIFMKKFSTDRTVSDYAQKIWGVEPIEITNTEIQKN